MSLRRVNGARVEASGFWPFRTHHFFYSKRQYFRVDRGAYRRLRRALDASSVAAIGVDGDRVLWWDGAGLYWAEGSLDAEAVGLLLWDRERRQDARIERLRNIRAREQEVESSRRARIPDEVRAFVWERDDARCVTCGAEDELQFDHVIPVARGGGTAVENIQILCADCNRLKSDSIV